MKLPPMWRVELAEHAVERWPIAAYSASIPATSADEARVFVVRTAHGAAGLPCWKPLVRASLEHATAKAAG